MARVDCFGVHPNSARAEGGLDHQVGHPSEIRKRRPQAETRSAGCGFGVEVTNRKPLSLDLDAFERTARSAHAAHAPSPVGAYADASAETRC